MLDFNNFRNFEKLGPDIINELANLKIPKVKTVDTVGISICRKVWKYNNRTCGRQVGGSREA